MADDLSLLFRLKAENAQAKAAINDTRQAVAQLRQSFGPQLTQTVTLANKAFSDVFDNLNFFVGQRVPLIGGAFVRITENIRGLANEGKGSEKAVASVAKSIESIATQSGKTVPQIASFLTKFVQIEGQANRDKAAIDFFGASLGAKLIPELEKTGTALAGVSTESAAAGSGIAALAGPIGIAIVALAALVAGAVLAAKGVFNLAKASAEFQGKLSDLSAETNVAVETLGGLEFLIVRTGGDLNSVSQAIVNFQSKLNEAQNPLSKTAEQFRKFNIDTADTENALRQTFAALARMPEGFAQTNAAAEFFGARGGKQVLAILKETNGDLDATIKRLRELGILISEDDARAADQFNDQLALLEFQLRGLGTQAIPVLLAVLKDLSGILRDNRELFVFLQGVIKGLALPLSVITRTIKDLNVAIGIATFNLKPLASLLKEIKENSEIPPIQVPGVTPVPLPAAPDARQAAADAVAQAEAVVAAVKRSVAGQNQTLDELFQRGRRNREQQTEETIAENKRLLDADRNRIDTLLAQKEQEIKALDEAQKNRGEIVRRDTDDYRKINEEVAKLQQERLDKENDFNITSAALRAKAAKERADAIRNQLRNEADLLAGEVDRQIADIEGKIKRGVTAEDAGLKIIEQLEQAKIDTRIETVKKQKAVGFLTVQDQKELDAELQKLNQERDRLEDEQQRRRLDREQAAAVRTREILITNIDTLIQLEQSAGQRRIDTLQALANARVISEEEAAKQILKIRLQLIDDEIQATQTKLKAAASITDKDERIRTEADLNNQLKLLKDQRVSIETEGNRDIEEKRRQDLENERRYANSLLSIRRQTLIAEREIARTVIDLMILNFARRKDIIRAQVEADIKEENRRNQQAEAEIRNLRRDVAESNRTREEKLAAQLEIDDLEETEAERHRLALEEIRRRARLDEKNAEPLGRINIDLDNLKEFSRVIEDSIVPLGELLTRTFQSVSDAIGQVVSNYVLLGETGPAVARKILASALASIAAEAAVNAIKELALGFATLFFNPAESAAHFTAAGLWASIGGVAAIAGRSVAGDLFKSKAAGGGAGVAGSTSRSGELNPLNLARNAGPLAPPQIVPQIQPQRTVVEIRVSDSKFGKAITAHVVEDINNAGPIREVIAGDGNLNRG